MKKKQRKAFLKILDSNKKATFLQWIFIQNVVN